jgi:hypothetical protein
MFAFWLNWFAALLLLLAGLHQGQPGMVHGLCTIRGWHGLHDGLSRLNNSRV